MRRLALALLLFASPALAAAPVPKLSITSLQQLPIVTMRPYDEKADANAQVDRAFATAKKSGKRVLIDLGGNWCPDCIVLANFLELPEMRRFMNAHYEVAMVDVGRFDRNLQVPARFGFKTRLKGVPTLLIATPDGKLVNRDDVFATTSASSMTPKSLADYLAKYAK